MKKISFKLMLLLMGVLAIGTLFTSCSDDDNTNSKNKSKECNLPENFEEPQTDPKLYELLKSSNSTVNDLKKHVATENECDIEEVIIIRLSEQMGNGMYVLCVKGVKMKYRRTGSVFSRVTEVKVI